MNTLRSIAQAISSVTTGGADHFASTLTAPRTENIRLLLPTVVYHTVAHAASKTVEHRDRGEELIRFCGALLSQTRQSAHTNKTPSLVVRQYMDDYKTTLVRMASETGGDYGPQLWVAGKRTDVDLDKAYKALRDMQTYTAGKELPIDPSVLPSGVFDKMIVGILSGFIRTYGRFVNTLQPQMLETAQSSLTPAIGMAMATDLFDLYEVMENKMARIPPAAHAKLEVLKAAAGVVQFDVDAMYASAKVKYETFEAGKAGMSEVVIAK